MTKRKIEAYESSGNVFADLGLPNAEERKLKASIVIELHRLVKERGLTQIKAAKLIGISQPDLSNLRLVMACALICRCARDDATLHRASAIL